MSDLLLVALAGAACGVVNSIAGGGSLILFPTLLLTGMSPLSANVTNSVTTWPGYLGGVGAFRSEIHTRKHQLPWLLGATLAGSGIGCVLLLNTSEESFDAVVPWLVLVATVMTAMQPIVRKRLKDQDTTDARPPTMAILAIFVATIYGGYFGAALGVIVLAALSLTLNDTIKNLNATKSIISLVDASVSVVVFGLFGPVEWQYVLVAAPTTLLGGYAGGRVARKIDENVLRALVVALGAIVTIILFIRAFT